ncbi:MAG: hypothetical protein GXO87_12555 [Chlorobi bacterium]|nr:hypothetical protein [Chlorobiota bacterium]
MRNEQKEIYITRFGAFPRLLHVLVIISFLSLAITGMVIKFSEMSVFQTISKILGGYEVTGTIHRFAAMITFLYFFMHLWYLIKKLVKCECSFKEMFSGENSLVPNKNDLKEFIQTVKWFWGLGPRPQYGRWTYWEKFDYFAVFWGITVIGSTGLVLWFPEFFTAIGLPGWLINVATIIHSDEALLAAGFIFTVHFFNTHFRPDKFPMDTVIFTGGVPIEEFKEDRPREYETLQESGELEGKFMAPPSQAFTTIAKIFGFSALITGIIIIILIIYSMVFLYN